MRNRTLGTRERDPVSEKEQCQANRPRCRRQAANSRATSLSLARIATRAFGHKLAHNHIEKVEQLLREVASDHDCESIEIGFFGGEPLLNAAFIFEVLKCATSVLHSTPTHSELNISFDASLITNGVLLTGTLFRQPRDAGIKRFEVTLDGTRQVHDSRRPFKSGETSFTSIMENLTSIATLLREDYTPGPSFAVMSILVI